MASDKKNIHPATAGMLGAVIGAAGAVAAIALTDRQTRQNIGRKFGEVSKKATTQLSSMRQNIKEMQEDTRKVIDSSMKQLEDSNKKRDDRGNTPKKAA